MGEANAQLDATISSLVAPQWEDIRSKLEAAQTDEEKQFRPNLEKGIGRASPLNTIRLFDESNTEDDVRVVFYRDSASWCPYCHKVWMSVRIWLFAACCLLFALRLGAIILFIIFFLRSSCCDSHTSWRRSASRIV